MIFPALQCYTVPTNQWKKSCSAHMHVSMQILQYGGKGWKEGVFFTTMHDWFSIGFPMILRNFLRVFIESDDPFQLLSNVRLLLLMKTDLNSLSSFTTVWFALFCCNVLFERLMIWWRSVKIRCYLLNYSLGKFFFFLVRNLWRNDYYAALRLTLNLFFSLLFDIAFGTGWKKKRIVPV